MKSKDDWVKCPRVTVTWADHYSEYEQGFTLDKVKKMVETLCIRKTTGYLLPVGNRRQIAIAGTIEDDGTVSEIFICMKKAVMNMEYLAPQETV